MTALSRHVANQSRLRFVLILARTLDHIGRSATIVFSPMSCCILARARETERERERERERDCTMLVLCRGARQRYFINIIYDEITNIFHMFLALNDRLTRSFAMLKVTVCNHAGISATIL